MSTINALTINTSSRNIEIPKGATGFFRVNFGDLSASGVTADNSIAIFAIAKGNVRTNPEIVLKKQIEPYLDENSGLNVAVRLSNADTRAMAVGSYVWELTLVVDPEYDDENNVVVSEETDNVYPINAVSMSALPKFEVKGTVPVV